MIAVQAFWSLFSSLNDQVVKSIYAQYLQTAAFKDIGMTTAQLQSVYPQLSKAQVNFLQNDYNYGLGGLSGLLVWVDAGLLAPGNLQSAYYVLQNYFRLSYSQMEQILAIVRAGISTSQTLLVDNHYCSTIFPNFTDCSPESVRLFSVMRTTSSLDFNPRKYSSENETNSSRCGIRNVPRRGYAGQRAPSSRTSSLSLMAPSNVSPLLIT